MLRFLVCSAITLCAIPQISRAQDATQPDEPKSNAIVAADGSGKYTTVQEAINAAPQLTPTDHPWTILIRPGTYKEHIYIQREKRFITLLGEDPAKTILTFNLNANMKDATGKAIGTFSTPSTYIDADDFTCRNLTFENSAGAVGQALAIRIDGDRDVFTNCRFLGWQDTILGNRGRHYLRDCFIAGATDFIFGAATEFYDHCQIECAGNGYITAASTEEKQPYGFVFSHCMITGKTPEVRTYLGRPWRAYASVTYLYCEMSDVVRPVGWDNWKQPEREKTARYTEGRSEGPGGSPLERVTWSKQLTDHETDAITSAIVLAGDDHWNPGPP